MGQGKNASADAVKTRAYHHDLPVSARDLPSYEWKVEGAIPFDELIVSWNASRPLQGEYRIDVSVAIDGAWSPPLHYAAWGAKGQSGGDSSSEGIRFKIHQDIVALEEGTLASGFRIVLTASGGASFDQFYSLQASAARVGELLSGTPFRAEEPVDLKVPLVSQFVLHHPRRGDMCSPSSASSVAGYLMGAKQVDPVAFALHARDEAFDIFGNWVLNTAQASSLLGSSWRCWVERLGGFGDIYSRLKRNLPVVVSVKGALPGARFPYPNGHLIVVRGYDPRNERVLCMDPAFSYDAATAVDYHLPDFMDAWSRRRFLAYLFEPRRP